MIKADKIYRLILDELEQGPVEFRTITTLIYYHNLQPTHPHTWDAVHDILQGLIDQGEIARMPGVDAEFYIRTEP